MIRISSKVVNSSAYECPLHLKFLPAPFGDCKILLCISLMCVLCQEVCFLVLCVYAALKYMESPSTLHFHRVPLVQDS